MGRRRASNGGKPLEHAITIGESRDTRSFKNTDLGGKLNFPECILDGSGPGPDGEGYADVRVLEGIERALASGTGRKAVGLEYRLS